MTCIIIEDEIPAQKILISYINKLPNLELKGVFNNAIEANTFLNKQTIDVIFLDINLPDISGIDFIKTIKQPPAIIITTAYPDFALPSFELETIVDYLVKPVSFERFLKAIKKATDRTKKNISPLEVTNSEILFLNVDKTLHKIILSDILYLESYRNYITIVTLDQKFTFIDSLKNWNEKLSKKTFSQVHKSYIINRTYIDKISGNEIYVKDKRIPVGRTYKQDLLKQLKII